VAHRRGDGEADEGIFGSDRHDTDQRVAGRARIKGRNGGTLTPFRPGDRHMTGYHKPANLAETLQLARKHSPDAMRTLIRNLDHEDGRIATMSASLILERAWGKPREMKPEDQQPAAQIDLTQLSGVELAILVKLAESGRLRSVPTAEDETAPEIEGKAG
jgi:hypothetical protein